MSAAPQQQTCLHTGGSTLNLSQKGVSHEQAFAATV
jgi:hypothetical protein